MAAEDARDAVHTRQRTGEDIVIRGARVLDPVEGIDAMLDVPAECTAARGALAHNSAHRFCSDMMDMAHATMRLLTIAALRARKTINACGLAFAAQEISSVPTTSRDARLDLVLTEREVIDCRIP